LSNYCNKKVQIEDGEEQENQLSLAESLMRDLRSLAIESQDDELLLNEETRSIAESIDSNLSLEATRSVAESFVTQSSTRSQSTETNNPATEERRLHQRQKQIDYGKVSLLVFYIF
jgi:hypothetical protein